MSRFKGRQEECGLTWEMVSLFCSGLQGTGCGPSTPGAICFTQSTDSNVNLTQKQAQPVKCLTKQLGTHGPRQIDTEN